MNLLPVGNIDVPTDRVRRDFSDSALSELADSIASQGLFHPLVVRADGKTLVAGERRLRAIRQLYGRGSDFTFDGQPVPLNTVPVVKLCEMDDAALLESELHENSKREQLCWQDQAAALDRLFELKKKQNPNYPQSQLAADTGRSAVGSGSTRARIARDLALAPWLNDPEVAGKSNPTEAMKVVEHKLKLGQQQALAKRFGTSVFGPGECHQGDMRLIMPTFEAETFDLIIADPPYGIGADKMKNQDAVAHCYHDSREHSDQLYQFIAREGFRVCKPEAHAYIFCDVQRFTDIREVFSSAGWACWPRPLIWHRGPSIGLLPRPEHGPRQTYEAILFASKGDKPVHCVRPDVLDHAHDHSIERGAHKPPALYEDLIGRSCLPCAKVLDPCCGAGALFEAAQNKRVFAVGIELDPAGYAQSVQRMNKELV